MKNRVFLQSFRQTRQEEEMTKNRKQHGLSLVEAMVVIAIAAAALTAAAPSFGGLIEKQRLEGAASQLASDLQFARTEAVMRTVPVRLSIHEVAHGSCYLLHTGSRAQCSCRPAALATCTGDAVALKTVQWPAEDKVALTANVTSILFDPLHGTSSPAGSLRVSDTRGRVIQHVVNIMGRVRSCAPLDNVPGYPAC
jgi:type IV fimbrial biogenesis protein FimT